MSPRRIPVLALLGLLLALGLVGPGPARADNSIVQTIYTADPAPLVHNGRIYLYTGRDEDGSTTFTMKEWRTTGTWSGGFQAEVTVTAGASAISGWRVNWTPASGTDHQPDLGRHAQHQRHRSAGEQRPVQRCSTGRHLNHLRVPRRRQPIGPVTNLHTRLTPAVAGPATAGHGRSANRLPQNLRSAAWPRPPGSGSRRRGSRGRAVRHPRHHRVE